jgi:hypothetical protein
MGGKDESDGWRDVLPMKEVSKQSCCVGVVYVARTLPYNKIRSEQVADSRTYHSGEFPQLHSSCMYVINDINRSAWYFVRAS